MKKMVTLTWPKSTKWLQFAVAIIGLILNGPRLHAVEGHLDYQAQPPRWLQGHLLNPASKLPFSFVYDRRPSAELLKVWSKTTETKQLDSNRTQYTLGWNDPKTGLQVRLAAVEYANSPVVEWTMYFRKAASRIPPSWRTSKP